MAFTPANGNGTLNGTTAVTLVAAPAANVRRTVINLTVMNRDTAAVTMTLRYVDGANTRQLWKGRIEIDDSFVWDREILLDDTDDSVTAVLAAAVATTQPDYVVTYADRTVV